MWKIAFSQKTLHIWSSFLQSPYFSKKYLIENSKNFFLIILLGLLVNSVYMKRFVSKPAVCVKNQFAFRRPEVRFPATSFFYLQQKMVIFGTWTDSIFNISYFQKVLGYDFERSWKILIFKFLHKLRPLKRNASYKIV